MADLDTRSKRASSVGLLLAFVAAPVLPDGTISAGDRQHVASCYSGIAATVSIPFVYSGIPSMVAARTARALAAKTVRVTAG